MFAADSIHEPSEKLEVSSLRREDSKSFQIPPEPFSQNRDLSEFLHNDVSLNFTVTSRAANPLFDSLQLAGSELEKVSV